MNTSLQRWICSVLLYVFTSAGLTPKIQAQETFNLNGYGSLRVGLEHIHAGIDGDGWYWRDYLSRVGVKPEWKVSDDISVVGHLEYGLKGQLLDDLAGSIDVKKRLSYLGIKHRGHSAFFGRQNVVWHQFVRTNYFLGGLDTERQGVLRDDNMLQYFYKSQQSRLGVGVRFDETKTLGVRNVQVGGQTQYENIKLQFAIVSDEFGPAQGTLVGVKLWYYPTSNWTLSAYSHNATSDFDEYAGSSSGVVKIHQAEPNGLLKAIQTCSDEKRSSYGVYTGYKWARQKVHGRVATDRCKSSGEVDSLRVEYIYAFKDNLRAWLSVEHLRYRDQQRSPLTEVDKVYHSQLGIRYDF